MLDLYLRSRGEGFGEEVKRRILLGTYVLSSGYYDAYYLQAQKVRTLIIQDFTTAFETVDVIATPTCPEPAFLFGAKSGDPLRMYLSDICTANVNLAGLPAISVPVPSPEGGVPAGLQIIGPAFGEERILRVALTVEKVVAGGTQ